MRKYKIGVLTALSILFVVAPNLNAAPNSDITWTEPTNYEDGTAIPGTDQLSYTLYCSDTSGGPYTFFGVVGVDTTQALTVDLNACVNGTPGTYYFVLTTTSGDYNTESGNSNEVSKTYTAADLGKIPLPPVIISIT